MFHSINGFFWRREEDGSVAILQGNDFGDAEELVTFDSNTWASIVASVSSRGENAVTFDAAVRLHNDTD